MSRKIRYLPLVALPIVLLSAAHPFGGWATITVEDLPEYMTARQPVTLAFTVRQHGVTPLSGLKGSVEARSGGLEVRASAVSGKEAGRYSASLTLPQAGAWTITIKSGFMNSERTLAPIQAIEPGVAAPTRLSETERGLRLFVAKGCVTCHVHRDAAGAGAGLSIAVGPELTGRHYPADFLGQLLADPAKVPLTATTRRTMPNLGLKPNEIGLLVAFLNAERHASH